MNLKLGIFLLALFKCCYAEYDTMLSQDLERIRLLVDTRANLLILYNTNITRDLQNVTKRLEAQEKMIENLSKRQTEILNKLTNLDKREHTLNSSIPNNNWKVIFRRQDGSINFNRNWTDYKQGFGSSKGEFFIGLEKLYEMTSSCPHKELKIFFKTKKDGQFFAIYDHFEIGAESEKYALKKLGKYNGNIGDFLRDRVGLEFVTYDRDDPKLHTKSGKNCAQNMDGAWWFSYICHGHLTSTYLNGTGINFSILQDSRSYFTPTFVEMKIRSKSL